jgi:membrane protease YdiL (CAAX protease family)
VTLPPARTAAFEAFVAPARGRPALWRLGLGLALIAAVWAAVTVAMLPVVPLLPPRRAEQAVLVMYLFGFGGMILGVGLAVRLLGRRRFAGLFGPAGFEPRPFLVAAAVMAGLAAVSVVVWLLVAGPARRTGILPWAAWLPLALPAILVQSAAEELVFRGYLLQGLAARFRSALGWWLVPSLLFGLLHWNPAEFGPNAWLAVGAAAVTGLVLADVTARTGGLSAAIGLHFANNVSALLLLSTPSEVGALSLYVTRTHPSDAEAMRLLILADIATTLAAYGLWLVAARRLRQLHPDGRGSI